MYKMNYQVDRKVWQLIWDSIMTPYDFGWGGRDFENDTFQVKMYRWNDDDDNDYHFWHKPTGFMIEWYKYPLRGAWCNRQISDNQFVDVLYDCINSIEKEKTPRVIHDVDEWWLPAKERKSFIERIAEENE